MSTTMRRALNEPKQRAVEWLAFLLEKICHSGSDRSTFGAGARYLGTSYGTTTPGSSDCIVSRSFDDSSGTASI